ncbi:hypothetical protein BH11PSE3_BH11PSE3_08090 [soil metagenome]
MKKLIILDDVFDDSTVAAIAAFDYGDGEQWYEMGSNPVHEQVFAICAMHFDLTAIVGYEMWRNDGNPGWHVDKDERLFRDRKEQVYPQCSAVYYAQADAVSGGEFFTEDVRYFPRTNRLVLFSPGIYHGVAAYAGTRLGVSFNPWNHRIESWRT